MRTVVSRTTARHRGSVSFCWLAWAVTLLAAMETPAQVLNFNRYNEEQGLPSAAVMDMAQSPEGSVWLATRNGLVRYDGLNWDAPVTYEHVANKPISAVAFDADGAMWVVGHQAAPAIHVHDAQGWRTLGLRGVDSVAWSAQAVLPGPKHDGHCQVALIVGDVSVFAIHGPGYIELDLPDDCGRIGGGAWDGDDLLLACYTGLLRVRGLPGSPSIERVEDLPAGPVLAAIAAPETGDVHLVGTSWTGRLVGGRLEGRREIEGLAVPWVSGGISSMLDADGSIFLGDLLRNFVIYPHRDVAQEISIRNGLAGNGCTAMMVDQAGPLWFAGLRGVSRLLQRSFSGYDRRHGLLNDEVSAVHERTDGTTLLGHAGGLTVLDDPPRVIDFEMPYDDAARVSDIIDDGHGGVWLALSSAGLAHLDADENLTWHNEQLEREELLVYALLRLDDGSLLMGCDRGLWRTIEGRVEAVPLGDYDVVGWPGVRRLGRLRDGTIWVATSRRGVFLMDDHGIRQFASRERSLLSTYGVFETDDHLWVATSAGLGELTPGGIVRATEPGPVIDRPLYAITASANDEVWFGTDVGVRVWDGVGMRTYGIQDGLVGSEINRDALICDRLGRMWIGTDRGVSIYDGYRSATPVHAPSTRIVRIEADGVDHSFEDELEVGAETIEMVFHFRSTPFRDERRLRFRTWLEGLEPGWGVGTVNPTQSVRYTSLPPGRYRFHVQALDADGTVGLVATTGDIIIRPPLWQQPWFVFLEILVAMSLLALVVSAWQNRRYARRLAGEVDDRTRDLAASETAVRRESERLATVLASITEAVLVVDGEGRIAMGNVALTALTDVHDDELVGRRLAEVFPILPEEIASKELGSPFGPKPSVFNYRYSSRHDGVRELEVSVSPLADQGTGGHVLAFRDMTERRQLENEHIRAQKLESLGVLAGGLAHDFNNLMTVVLGHVSMVELAPSLAVVERESLIQMREATEQARHLTGQLLTFARGGAPCKTLTDIGELVLQASRLAFSGARADLSLDLPTDLDHAEVDHGQIEQVLNNLLINAQQAMPEGGRVWVRARNAMWEGQRAVAITVRDEGPGVPEDIREQIFEPYFSTKDTGTGLGLTISYSVLRRHGGDLEVAAGRDGGAEFTVRLPASEERFVAPVAVAAPSPEREVSAGLRVLVMDDEASIRDITARMLQRQGHTQVTVSHGEAAAEAVREAQAEGHPFDVAILDLTIAGGLGGREALVAIRRLDPGIKAVVASGYSNDPVMSDPAAHGFQATLRKPFDGKTLAQVLAKVIG